MWWDPKMISTGPEGDLVTAVRCWSVGTGDTAKRGRRRLEWGDPARRRYLELESPAGIQRRVNMG